MSKDFEPSSEVWQLNLKSIEWEEKASMYAPRLTSTGLFYSETQDMKSNLVKHVYAIGGNEGKTCERYDVIDGVWEIIPSFKDKTE